MAYATKCVCKRSGWFVTEDQLITRLMRMPQVWPISARCYQVARQSIDYKTNENASSLANLR